MRHETRGPSDETDDEREELEDGAAGAPRGRRSAQVVKFGDPVLK